MGRHYTTCFQISVGHWTCLWIQMFTNVYYYFAAIYFLLPKYVRLILLSQIWCNPQQYGHYAQAETNALQKRLIAAKVRISEKDCLIYQATIQPKMML